MHELHYTSIFPVVASGAREQTVNCPETSLQRVTTAAIFLQTSLKNYPHLQSKTTDCTVLINHKPQYASNEQCLFYSAQLHSELTTDTQVETSC